MFEGFILEGFIGRALLAGCGIALVAGPLGCVIVWRRMAYFGDTLSHAALMGVALGVLFGFTPMIGVVVTGICVGLLLLGLQSQENVSADTLLGILSHGALSVGLILVAFLDKVRVDLMGYLFGDILAVSATDIYWIYGGAIAVLGGLAVIWRPLIALTVHADTAAAEGISSFRTRLAFMLLIALTVALAMKIVGVLLITALLIIPAATGRGFARSPEVMAINAMIVGVLAVFGGVGASLKWDTPSGPSIVVAALALFAVSLAAGKTIRQFLPR